jgi:hypothetical protein
MHPPAPFSRTRPLGECRLWGARDAVEWCRRGTIGIGCGTVGLQGRSATSPRLHVAIEPRPYALHAKGTRCPLCGMLAGFSSNAMSSRPAIYHALSGARSTPTTTHPCLTPGEPAPERSHLHLCEHLSLCLQRPTPPRCCPHACAASRQAPAASTDRSTTSGAHAVCQHDNVHQPRRNEYAVPPERVAQGQVMVRGMGSLLCQACLGHSTAHNFAS